MRTAFLFPGQGSQHPGMLHQMPDHPVIKATIQEASEVLGQDVMTLDDEVHLRSTVHVQLCLLIAGVAAANVLQAEGITVDILAGHSVGSFGAAVISGALSFHDAVTLVQRRGKYMEKAYPSGYGMGVISGLPELRLQRLIESVFTPNAPVYLANINAHNQITVAGKLEGIELVLRSARSAGARKTDILRVNVPSHCELLDSVADQLTKDLAGVTLQQPIIPLAGSRRARRLVDLEDIREDLGLGVAQPVRWHDMTTLLFELGVRFFIEMPSGHVLSTLGKRAFPEAKSVAMDEAGLETVKLLAKEYME